MSNNVIEVQRLRFENGNTADAITCGSDAAITEIIAKLERLIPFKKVILILGGADELEVTDANKLAQLFGLGIARAAVEACAIIIDSGSNKGIVCMMGEGVAARGYKTSVIGIGPIGVVKDLQSEIGSPSLEPNHSHFILVQGDKRGMETSTMFKIAHELSNPVIQEVVNNKKHGSAKTKSNKVPAIAVLAGGGAIAKNEVLRAVRQNLPIIIVKGSGGFADEIVSASERRDPLKEEPVIAEIIADGELHFHDLAQPVKGIERLIIRELGIDNVLMQAWETFAFYDHNANIQQKKFNNMQMSILLFGVISTFLVIFQQVYAPKNEHAVSKLLASDDVWAQKKDYWFFWWILHYILILIPILLTVLVTAANRFKQGSKWLLLRAAAESIKREIFRYRTRAMYYNQKPEQQLAQRIEAITRRTMRTEVNTSSLKPYNKDEKDRSLPMEIFSGEGDSKDDGFSYLAPDRYIAIRLTDQAEFYRKRAVHLEGQLNMFYWLTFIVGGLGSFMAAVGLEVWIAVTTSMVGAFLTYIGYKQTERTLMKYNQSATDLTNVKGWWNALSAEEQANQKNIDSLVEHTEQVLQSELDGWIQQMQNALAELRDSQKKYEKSNKEDEATKGNQDGQFSKSASSPEEKTERAAVAGVAEKMEAGKPEEIRGAEIEENRQPLEPNNLNANTTNEATPTNSENEPLDEEEDLENVLNKEIPLEEE